VSLFVSGKHSGDRKSRLSIPPSWLCSSLWFRNLLPRSSICTHDLVFQWYFPIGYNKKGQTLLENQRMGRSQRRNLNQLEMTAKNKSFAVMVCFRRCAQPTDLSIDGVKNCSMSFLCWRHTRVFTFVIHHHYENSRHDRSLPVNSAQRQNARALANRNRNSSCRSTLYQSCRFYPDDPIWSQRDYSRSFSSMKWNDETPSFPLFCK
jgi:hypothetical protein